MGGNSKAVINDKIIYAEKINLSEVDRDELTFDVVDLLLMLDIEYEKLFKVPIWEELSVFADGYVFNGSSEYLFNENITTKDLIKIKDEFGDIDVTIPISKLENLFNLLKKFEGIKITNKLKYLGHPKEKLGKKRSINTVFQYLQNEELFNFQIDFEGIEYDFAYPSYWGKFSHSSPLDDLRMGLKGVAHKYLLINLTRAKSLIENGVIATPGSLKKKVKGEYVNLFYEKGEESKIKIKKTDIVSTHSFYVEKGLRKKLKPLYYKDSEEQIRIDGKLVFYEIPTSESEYFDDLESIGEFLFIEKMDYFDDNRIKSFIGVLDLMKFLSKEIIQKTFELMIDKSLFCKSCQQLERENPEKDKEIKMKMISLFKDKFDFVGYDGFMRKVSNYYMNYGSE